MLGPEKETTILPREGTREGQVGVAGNNGRTSFITNWILNVS